MKLELIIFDWSGTISDDRRPVYEANMRIFRDYKKPVITFDEWLPRTTMTPIEMFSNYGILDDEEKLFTLYKKYLDEVNILGIIPELYPEVHNVFNYLKEKNKKLSILSSHPYDNLKKEIQNYNLELFFDMILGNSKDKINGLKHIYNQLGKNSESVLYVGDTIYDIRSAKNAGVYSAGVCTGYHLKERLLSEKPDIIIDKLSDLKQFID